ncbi:3-oxosteroid 1-dehydrogenase [Brooklawnia cerclae]|uniref:3-oxosteroid 1-dehydrogenase n=1 Tax=Brooklawnia cerclae TaxID=349934 RepID=A0ABX0SM87_9ACTN|nr:FAD-binding protein [Brooklawnia cerclae]NIH58155.1 3-oxosteroid 1-dehydrogenase [Brooklawnia cerclae]
MSRRSRSRRERSGDEVFLPVATSARPRTDLMTDVVVVGSDPGALAAALACRQAGWEVLVAEPTGQLGGQAANGSGRLWLPGGSAASGGVDDDYATARDYFDRVVGDPDAATSAPRRHAFLTGTAALHEWLTRLGVELRPDGVGDNYPHVPGGLGAGRVFVPGDHDATAIGMLGERLPGGVAPEPGGVVDRIEQGARAVGGAARGRRLVHGGAGLVAALLAACQRLQVTVWWDAPVQRLITVSRDEAGGNGSDDPGAVTGEGTGGAEVGVAGVVIERAGRPVRVLAGRGVVLAQGGFGADARLRREYLPVPSRPAWTIGAAADAGIRQLAWAQHLGLELAGLGNAWWRPALWMAGAGAVDPAGALAAPHGFVVDATGRRFADEAAAGVDFCRALFARARQFGPETVPAWLIVDADHRRRYRLGDIQPGHLPRSAARSGAVISARTLPELAWRIHVDAAGLQATAERFDMFVETGSDDDFGRGSSVADRARGDAGNRPNPCLGAVARPPFHAVRVVPGDRGTKGGLLTDEHARVLCAGGPVPGLWAIGTAAASVTGAADPAPGTGLAEAMVMGRVCARSIT